MGSIYNYKNKSVWAVLSPHWFAFCQTFIVLPLWFLQALAPVAPVILVGTHLDVCEDDLVQECALKIQEVLSQPLFPNIRERHMLCACEESDSISRLRKAIAREASSFKVTFLLNKVGKGTGWKGKLCIFPECRGPLNIFWYVIFTCKSLAPSVQIQGKLVMGQLVPDCYVELERKLLQEWSRLPVEFPVLRHQRLLQLIEESQLLLEEGELAHAVRFLSETGERVFWFCLSVSCIIIVSYIVSCCPV